MDQRAGTRSQSREQGVRAGSKKSDPDKKPEPEARAGSKNPDQVARNLSKMAVPEPQQGVRRRGREPEKGKRSRSQRKEPEPEQEVRSRIE